MKKAITSIVIVLFFLAGIQAVGGAMALPSDKVPVIVGFKGKPDTGLIRAYEGDVKYEYSIIPAVACSLPQKAIDALERNPQIQYIEEDAEVYAIQEQLPWGVDRIDAEVVHSYNKGTGIKVAIVDTGINYDHPDLSVKGGVSFVSYTTDYMDDHGHGTHCAGIVAALDNEIGVRGVAPEADLYGVKVLDYRGSGSISDVIAGIQWCIYNGIQIISMSLGTSSHYQPLYDACEDAYGAGILIVAAAGNNYLKFWGIEFDTVTYPAKYYSVIAVGATDNRDVKASFSSTGPALEIVAPGVNILSTYLGESYATMSGTSMACPHVTGTAALVLTSDETVWNSMGYTNGDGSWTNIEVRTVLKETADDLGAAGQDNWYGHGLVDADEAAAESSVPIPPSDSDPPVITDATGNTSGTTGEPVTITAEITDNVDVVDARIHYTPIDGSETQIPMIEGAGNLWSADVPIASDKVGTIPYYITARDAADNEGRDPTTGTYSITVSDNDAPIANAGPDQTVMVGETVNFDGSTSSDNIGVTDYSWDFDSSDGIQEDATGVTSSHVYNTVGTYTVTLTVSDAAGNTASDTLIVTVGEASASPTMHVESIEMAKVSRWRGWRVYATATVTVVDSDDNPVEGATVYGHWEEATTDSDSGLTDVSGMVTLQSNALWRPSSGTTFTFMVDNIVKDGWTYNPSSNVETSDSVAV